MARGIITLDTEGRIFDIMVALGAHLEKLTDRRQARGNMSHPETLTQETCLNRRSLFVL